MATLTLLPPTKTPLRSPTTGAQGRFRGFKHGTRGGTRTHTPVRETDFESVASAKFRHAGRTGENAEFELWNGGTGSNRVGRIHCVDGWRDERMEEGKKGRVEERKSGGEEGWRRGRVEEKRALVQSWETRGLPVQQYLLHSPCLSIADTRGWFMYAISRITYCVSVPPKTSPTTHNTQPITHSAKFITHNS